mmetsp:Transcript_20851/g.54271  ORF Transcript_20851/g.54271 Transcript_20851/m.54271 type:complete len:299 (-) Transcript_20851:135-1031(-)
MTLVFGVLNLIVAVIVDTFAENRSKDVGSRAQEMEAQELEEKSILKKIFHKIDEDGSGALSFDELESGAKKVSEFSQWLRVMDIDDGDLRQLFEIVDGDGSGEVDPQEFADAMFRMKNTEAKTATKFVKHLVTRLDYEARDMHADLTLTLAGLTERTEKALQMLEPQNQVVDKALKDSSTTKQIRAESLELRFQEQVAKDVMAEVAAQSNELAGGVLGRLKLATSRISSTPSDAGSLPDVTKVGEATWDTAHLPDAFAHRRPDDSAARPASCSRPLCLQASGGGLGVTHSSEGGLDVA